MSTDISEVNNENIVKNLCEDSENMTKSFSKRHFTKTILKQGQGFLRPYLESTCVVDIIHGAVQNGDAVDKSEHIQKFKIPVGKNVEIILGSAETEMLRFIEKCILTMRKGEESEFVIKFPSDDSFNVNQQMLNSSVLLIINLHDFSETKPTWSLTSEEKYQLALLHKDKGTQSFKEDKMEAAFCQYSVAVIYLICITECTSVMEDKFRPEVKSQKDVYNGLKCVCYLNLAACQMKVDNHQSVIKNCTHALSLDPSNVKGLYRRAQANISSGKVEEARSDLMRALKIEPKNSAIISLLQECKKT